MMKGLDKSWISEVIILPPLALGRHVFVTLH